MSAVPLCACATFSLTVFRFFKFVYQAQSTYNISFGCTAQWRGAGGPGRVTPAESAPRAVTVCHTHPRGRLCNWLFVHLTPSPLVSAAKPTSHLTAVTRSICGSISGFPFIYFVFEIPHISEIMVCVFL